MQSLFFFVLIVCCTDAQNNRILQIPSHDNGHGWDIRLAVPGQPGNDYPTLSSIPRTRFSCAGKEPGYYADVETNCQVFRVCTVGATYGFQSFLCPNGTLFNQAVFVCDWWMNVLCNKSDELVSNRNDQFENLKLGPQLMKDVKKMLTHPVRNPVNTHSMKSKVIVMQNYKPPSGQLFPNGALLTPPERPPSHIYFPTKTIQTMLRQNDYKAANLAYSASTSNPQYIPPDYNTLKATTVRNVEILQRQRAYDQKKQDDFTPLLLTQNEKIISNGHTGQLPLQSRYINEINPFKNDQEIRQKYIDLRNRHRTENSNHIDKFNIRREQQDFQNVRFIGNLNEPTLHNSDSTTNISTYNQSKQQQPLFANTKLPTVEQKRYEGVSNRVSNDIVPPTILAKTVAYSRLVQEPKQGSPKSRITFKTWVLKPPRNPKLLQNSSPDNIPLNGVDFQAPYYYNKPIESVTIENDLQGNLEGYNYPNPTIPSLESNPDSQSISGLFVTPTTLNSLNELLVTLTTPQPIETSSLLFDPTTINSSARQYLPPTETSTTVANQYLPPSSTLRELSQYKNIQSITEATPSRIEYTTINKDDRFNPPVSQENDFNDNYNNLSFSDVLSKEKLDITINEIVNHTNDILQTASPANFQQYVEDLETQSQSHFLSDNNLSNKELKVSTAAGLKPMTLISIPSIELEPPIESFNEFENGNKISNLPFIKETSLPTIERTVSLKITIPERIANYLFKTHKDAKLEILNTDSSNYLILKNMPQTNIDASFIPLGKLLWNGNSNLSASQALVLSLVADSINKAKKYNNIIQDNVITPTSSAVKQFQGVNNEELGNISKTISKLTASQYTSKNLKSSDIKPNVYQSRNKQSLNHAKDKEAYTNNTKRKQTYPDHALVKPARLLSLTSENSLHSKQNQNPLKNSNSVPQANSDKIYSGQFYKYSVPEVTRQIINSPNLANSNIIMESDLDKVKIIDSVIPKNTITKPSDVYSTVNIFNTQNLPATKSQVASSTESPHFKTRDRNELVSNLLNVGSGITAQFQDKIVGTVLHPSDINKFVTYKKDQSYYLKSELLNEKKETPKRLIQAKNKQETENSGYPDLITFHFITSDNNNQNLNDASQEQLQKYRLQEINNFNENNRGTSISNDNIFNSTFPTDITDDRKHFVDSRLTKPRQAIARLYDGPSSYLAPQSSIGDLLLTERNENYKDRIEDLDENQNFNGYSRERPSREFNF